MVEARSRIAEGDLSPLADIDTDYQQVAGGSNLFIIAIGIENDDRDEFAGLHRWQWAVAGTGSWANLDDDTGNQVYLVDVPSIVHDNTVINELRIAGSGSPYIESGKQFEENGLLSFEGELSIDEFTESHVGISIANAIRGRQYEFRLQIPPEILNGNAFLLCEAKLTALAPDPLSGRALVIDQESARAVDQSSALAVDRGAALTVDRGSALAIDQEEALVIDRKAALTIDRQAAITIDRASALVIDREDGFTIDRKSALVIDQESALDAEPG